MAFIPTPGIVQATINYLSDQNVHAVNRLYCGASTIPTADDLQEIGDALYDVWVAQVMGVTQNSWQLTGIHMRAMNEEESIQLDDANAYPVDGEVSGAIFTPSQVCYTVTLNTGLVGRAARGRVYGVGLPATYQEATRLSVAAQADLQSAWNLVRSAMVTASHAINVVSFSEGGVPRAAGRPLPVLSIAVRFPLATQRRRLS